MFLTEFKDNKLKVICIKSEPTLAIVTVDGQSVPVPFAKGIGCWTANCYWVPEKIDIVGMEYLPVSKKLRQGEHDTPPKGYPAKQSEYAGPHYDFPVDTEAHCRSALAYFSKHHWANVAERKSAARKIMAACKRHGIEVGKEDNVYRAAHGD